MGSSTEDRYAAEARQGESIAAGLEGVWGWSTPAGRLRAARRARFLIRATGLEPGVRCLELGAGTGEFTVRLAETGCALVALELSVATAEICRERLGGRAEVVVGNAETGEGVSGREFDAIVGVSVLHHLDLDACLQTMRSLLRPGGRFAFSEPNMANPQVWAERHIGVVKRRRHVTPHETAFRPAGLRNGVRAGRLLGGDMRAVRLPPPGHAAALIPAVSRVGAALERTPLRQLAGSIRIAGRLR